NRIVLSISLTVRTMWSIESIIIYYSTTNSLKS
ncbi:uncharacterized protein METZ01_LOCUS199450, partial [marine metagenome]